MKPILFNTEMVRAILEGRKTVTRRVVKPQPRGLLVPTLPESCWPGYFAEEGTPRVVRPPYRPGDILYVRETWSHIFGRYVYRADYGEVREDTKALWRPSVHMPREAARIFLRVTAVRVERLREIGNCLKEGVRPGGHATAHMNDYDERCFFAALWDSTIKPQDRSRYGWEANPWVWVIEFERIGREEDANENTRSL